MNSCVTSVVSVAGDGILQTGADQSHGLISVVGHGREVKERRSRRKLRPSTGQESYT